MKCCKLHISGYLSNVLFLFGFCLSLIVEENESEDQQGGVGQTIVQTGNVELIHQFSLLIYSNVING